ncbi:MAG: hypothetical protein Ta2B_16900 [Termitinemataceae bacterium]|nr:MAG: hypothetical protein Ta2B_16900 [Termitinemataceae bacterium]
MAVNSNETIADLKKDIQVEKLAEKALNGHLNDLQKWVTSNANHTEKELKLNIAWTKAEYALAAQMAIGKVKAELKRKQAEKEAARKIRAEMKKLTAFIMKAPSDTVWIAQRDEIRKLQAEFRDRLDDKNLTQKERKEVQKEYNKKLNDLAGKFTPEQLTEARANAVMKRTANTVSEAQGIIAELKDKPLENKTFGITATLSNKKIGKLGSGKATSQSISPELHAMAVANIDNLFENAQLHTTHTDNKNNTEIDQVHPK